MLTENPPQDVTASLQKFYVASRELLRCGISPAWAVQKSFEEAVGGFQGDDVWRASHISPKAIFEAVDGNYKNIQRAHGVVEGRLSRYERTMTVLTGEEKPFSEWWPFWMEHDATVLITKIEHNSNKKFSLQDLVTVPRAENMFTRGGFSFKFRKSVELAWLKKLIETGAVYEGEDGIAYVAQAA